MQYDGTIDSIKVICKWANKYTEPMDDPWVDYLTYKDIICDVMVHTINGPETLDVGDWVVKNDCNHFYQITNQVFKSKYRKI